MASADEDLLEEAKRRFRLALDAESKQRERELEDLRFQVPELQWDEQARRDRQGMRVGAQDVPARPILSIPKLDQPIQLVLNQQKTAHLGVKIQPLSPEADEDVAEVIQGLYRKIERDSRADQARAWAFDRAVKCGRGAYRVNTRYDESGGHPFDQTITVERVLYQDTVHFDPAAQEADHSDGRWVFLAAWVPLDDFRRTYPDAETTEALNDFTFLASQGQVPDWVRGDKEHGDVLVAEYFYKETTATTLCLLADHSVCKESEAEGRAAEVVATRNVEDVKVWWCKLTGFEVLEKEEWNGKYIPIIPVLGRELQPFDSERRWVGIIGPAKDAQRLYNYAASSAVELAALEPKAPWIGGEGFMEGHEAEWQQSNTRNLPALQYKPTTVGEKPVPPPMRAQVDVGRLGPSMALLQQADDFIQSSTSTFDPSLGRLSQKERSGKAIMALQDQADAGTSQYLQSLVDVSMSYEARVILDLIPVVYERPGRLARTLDVEDKTEMVMLNQPFVVHPQTRRPVAVEVVRGPDGEPVQPLRMLAPMPQPQPQPGMGGPGGAPPPAPPKIQYIDLRKGVYSVAVSVGKSKQTLQQEAVDEIGQLLQAAPQLMPIIGPIYFRFRAGDLAGADEIAEILGKLRDKQFPGLTDEEGAEDPAQQRAKVQALEQQVQMMQAQLQAAIKAIETEQVKQQAVLEKAQMDNATKVKIAEIEQGQRATLEQLRLQVQRVENMLQRAHETERDEFEAAHETGMAVIDAAGKMRPPDRPKELDEPKPGGGGRPE